MCNYYEHLEKIGFEWENTAIDLKFSLKLSKDEKKFIKKWQWAEKLDQNNILTNLEYGIWHEICKKTLIFSEFYVAWFNC